jgi:trans-2,3-dihydro-3-hydroxyanthranilate isomerase
MKRRYVVADVFTDTPFQGNPVAVVLDAEGMSKAQMQQVAVEFGYSETTFVLPPDNPSSTARVRIFTLARDPLRRAPECWNCVRAGLSRRDESSAPA